MRSPWVHVDGWGTAPARLSARVRTTGTGCWEWQGALSTSGYGKIGVGSRLDGTKRVMPTHRLAYELSHGAIPTGLLVCHHCDNRICCNPDHLFLGTYADNMADMDRKGRRVNSPRPGEGNGRAVLSEADVLYIRESDERGVDLAAKFGVCKSTITAIRKRRLWRCVA